MCKLTTKLSQRNKSSITSRGIQDDVKTLGSTLNHSTSMGDSRLDPMKVQPKDPGLAMCQ